MASLIAKIVIPIIVLAAGVGFFLGQREGSVQSPQPPREHPLAQASESAGSREAAPPGPAAENEGIPATGAPDAGFGAAEDRQVNTAEKAAEPPKISKTPEPPTPPKAPAPAAPAPAVPAPDGPFAFDPAWRDAVVNPYCAARYGNAEDISFGSGAMIDPRGIILTNAHVAMEFLFADWPNPSLSNCFVRIGSPAESRYRAALLYLPGGWVDENLSHIDRYVPYEELALGKKDYALLYITKTSDPQGTLPASFPYLSLDTGPLPPPGSSAYVVGYPASFLGAITAMQNLSLLVSPTAVDSVRSIKNSNTLDVLAFKGMIAGQHGSSGGAVITAGGKLTALPAFFDKGGQGRTTSDSVVNAITIDYISRDLKADTGFSLAEFIARDDPRAISNTFMSEAAPSYQQRYVTAWKKMGFIVPGTY